MNSTKTHAAVYSVQRIGLSAATVQVEVDISRGLHAFSIIGLPDKAVDEAKGRMSSAIKHSGFKSPAQQNQKITVSLAPGDIKKTGTLFDVPIAIAYLLASKSIDFSPADKVFIGELSLDGQLQRAQGVLPILKHAKDNSVQEIYIPRKNIAEAELIEDLRIFPVDSLKQLIEHLQGKALLQPLTPSEKQFDYTSDLVSFASIKGQESVKRALAIAAAGGHNIAMFGPPGTGKTLLARSLSALLPTLTKSECVEVTSIHSIAHITTMQPIWVPPFRSPHHSSSYASIVGGGVPLRPGEISLAHRGVLFLDEFPEYDRRVIESLREPLEDRCVTITRTSGVAQFPASCILVIAFNPCPCGNLGSTKPCTCSQSAITAYRRKLTGPIMDRIDLWVSVEASGFDELEKKRTKMDEERMQELREKIVLARIRQDERYSELPIRLNSETDANTLETHLTLDAEVASTLKEVAEKFELSPRGYHRVIKCARTIADLEGRNAISEKDILEAVGYRNLSQI